MGNYHAGFLGGKAGESPLTYPVAQRLIYIKYLRHKEG